LDRTEISKSGVGIHYTERRKVLCQKTVGIRTSLVTKLVMCTKDNAKLLTGSNAVQQLR